MITITKSLKNPAFNLDDSSIAKIDVVSAASGSLLGSSAIVGLEILKTVKYRTGLAAANFSFPGVYNVLTNPLTYPQYLTNEGWAESYMAKAFAFHSYEGHIPTTLNFFEESKFSQDSDSAFVNTNLTDKIAGSGISLGVYDAINDLKRKYQFDDDVFSFILRNDQLIPFLKTAAVELDVKFPKSNLSLEIRHDYEINDWMNLFLYISYPIEGDDSFDERYDDFVSCWLFKQSDEIKKLVTVVDKKY